MRAGRGGERVVVSMRNCVRSVAIVCDAPLFSL